MSDMPIDLPAIGRRIRETRVKAGITSLEHFADLIRDSGCDRPSGAKISRVETGVQPVPLDILGAVSTLTEIPENELRPDLAQLARRFTEAAE